MSEENIAILRRTFEALERGDLAGVLADLDENMEVRMPPEFPGAENARGPEGYVKIRAELEEVARDIRYELAELIDAGDRVFAVVRFAGHARHTDIPFDLPVYFAYTFRDGKIVRMEAHLEREKGLQAVGLAK